MTLHNRVTPNDPADWTSSDEYDSCASHKRSVAYRLGARARIMDGAEPDWQSGRNPFLDPGQHLAHYMANDHMHFCCIEWIHGYHDQHSCLSDGIGPMFPTGE